MAKKPGVKFNIEKLQVIATSLKKMDDAGYRVQVGLFGDKAVRKNAPAGLTNAEVGFVHEMGSVSRKIPRRSFLLDTFTQHGEELEKTLKPQVESLFKTGKIEEYLKQVGIACTNLVIEAFDTGGWGAWPQNAYATILRKLSGTKMTRTTRRMEALKSAVGGHLGINKPLIDTGQLWQAITSRTVRA